MTPSAIPPVRKSIRVNAASARAFELFTLGMHRWWPAAHTLNQGKPRETIVVEPRVGGRWYERATDGTICEWGNVILWEPPLRVVYAWRLDGSWTYDPNFLTEVEIRFTPDGDGTLVSLEHRNLERYGVHLERARAGLDSEDGWMGGLRLFAAQFE